MKHDHTPQWLRRAVVAGLLRGLLLVGFVVMRLFLAAIAWAAILRYVSWPLHWSLAQAQRFVREAQGLNLQWLEEPIRVDAPDTDTVRALLPLARGGIDAATTERLRRILGTATETEQTT